MKLEGQIKCTYILDELKADCDPKMHAQLEYANGDKVSENEVDIGQEEWPHRIPKTASPLGWHIENYTPDIPDQYWQKRCFAVMFRSVGLIIPFKYFSTSDPRQAYFKSSMTKDLHVFDDRPSVLAQAYLLPTGVPDVDLEATRME